MYTVLILAHTIDNSQQLKNNEKTNAGQRCLKLIYKILPVWFVHSEREEDRSLRLKKLSVHQV